MRTLVDIARAIQHTFSKPGLVNLISKDSNMVITHCFTLQTSDYDVIFDFNATVNMSGNKWMLVSELAFPWTVSRIYNKRPSALNLIILMDYSMHVDRICMKLAILYFKRSQVEFSERYVDLNLFLQTIWNLAPRL